MPNEFALTAPEPPADPPPMEHPGLAGLPEGNVHVCFSGGRTSARLLKMLLDHFGGTLPPDWRVVFANTGAEFPQTLDFVQECSERWGVDVQWLEYIPEKPLFRAVDHATASRAHEPLEALIVKRQYTPNAVARFCTAELKVLCSARYLRSLGWERWTNILGIRADEPRRAKPAGKVRWMNAYPLVGEGVTAMDVSEFWEAQDFDLRLPNHRGVCWMGNCDGCFLKSEAKLALFQKLYPERAAFWERMERKGFGNGSFSKRYTRRQLRESVERNRGQLELDGVDLYCQADGGECTG